MRYVTQLLNQTGVSVVKDAEGASLLGSFIFCATTQWKTPTRKDDTTGWRSQRDVGLGVGCLERAGTAG